MFSVSFRSCMRMGCSPDRFSTFRIEFSSGCSPLSIICIETEFYSGWCPTFKKYWVVAHVFFTFSVLHENGLFPKFQTEFSSGCSLLWITCIEIEFYSSQCLISTKIFGCSPCVLEFFRLVREWVEAHLGYQI